MYKVLIIEDDERLNSEISTFLSRYEIVSNVASSPLSALDMLKNDNYDIVILDLILPELDGFEICKLIRKQSNIPIIISSAKESVSDKVLAFELGANDYLVKPYDPRELIARIKVALREKAKPDLNENVVFILNEDTREINFKGNNLQLTNAEYNILTVLIKNKNKILSREDIIEQIPNITWDKNDRTIDIYIGHIRKKIGDSIKSPEFIKSIWGVGYMLVG